GAASQLEKIDMLDFADLIAINKFDRRGAADALRDVKKQVRRNHQLWEVDEADLPVFGTIASQFNDAGVTRPYHHLLTTINAKTAAHLTTSLATSDAQSVKTEIIPARRVRYLAEIAETIRNYGAWVDEQAQIADQLQAVTTVKQLIPEHGRLLREKEAALREQLDKRNWAILEGWEQKVAAYSAETYTYHVRNRPITVNTTTTTLSHNQIPRVSLPKYSAWGDILRWNLLENVPGEFPFAAGVFPFKRQGEDPTRMFAGEGDPERTNRRFHYLSHGVPAKRLSTAFDSVTLYGNDPAPRPDIYGKIGNSGVSVPTLDDAKRLYSGFNLCDRSTSVSMTINGPAATMLAFFLNTAIDQQCELYIRANGLEAAVEQKLQAKFTEMGLQRPQYHGDLPEGNDGLGLLLLGITGDQILEPAIYAKIKTDTLSRVRGTIQADILKEDQAQNTCIYSTEFSLRLMGDIQQYFIDHGVRNFYSVSISGYHMAEAGANPISQLAFTLANGFTF
ncbi:MAG TPA: hypothetical protein ENJ56_01955, partial [Anaerolineae bacterium]|nr:hypothetical protein [Anaerolineae bacterium]